MSIENYNFAFGTRAILVIPGLTKLPFYVQDYQLPTVTLGAATQATPFVTVPIPGDKLVFESLRVKFVLDEYLAGWIEVFNWMRGLGFPQSFEQYETKTTNRLDVQLRIQTNHITDASVTFKFVEAWPTALSSVEYSTQDDGSIVRSASAEFRYAYFYPEVRQTG